LKFRAGYGSSKDVNGYRDLGLSKEQIFIVGKSNKKQQNLATVSDVDKVICCNVSNIIKNVFKGACLQMSQNI
jgi:hypothetical protein